MATLPSWLGGFEPGQVFSLLNNARLTGNQQRLAEAAQVRQTQQEANKLQLAQQAQAMENAQRAQELAIREMALNNSMTKDAFVLDQERKKAELEAQIAARQFQGTQGLKEAIARGEPFESALLKFLPDIAFGSPNVLSSVANTINTTDVQAENARLARELDEKLSANKNATALQMTDMRAANALQIAEMKIANALSRAEAQKSRMNDADKLAMNADLEVVVKDFGLEPDQKARRIEEIRSKYSTSKPAPKNPAQTQSDLPVISNDAERAELQSGELYIDPKGVTRRKP